MKKPDIKILLRILFILFFILDIVFFIKTRNFSVTNQLTNYSFAGFYTLAFLFLLFGVVLFIIFLKLIENLNSIKKQNIELSKKLEKEKSVDEEKKEIEETIDIKKIILSLVPNEKYDSIEKYTEEILIKISKVFDIVLGMVFIKNPKSQEFEPVGTYAYYSNEAPKGFKLGETLAGQVAKDQKILNLNDLPNDYLSVASGLGNASPRNLLIVPIVFNNQTIGIIELATFIPFNINDEKIFEEFAKEISNKINTFIK